MTRPTNEERDIRAEYAAKMRQQIDELNAKHAQVVQFYQDRAQEDAQTISELAARVAELERSASIIMEVHRLRAVRANFSGCGCDYCEKFGVLLERKCTTTP